MWSLIGLIGLCVQTGISALLCLFFYLLKQHAGRRSRFFRLWTAAWVALLAALLCLAVSFYGLMRFASPNPVLEYSTLVLYQAGKLGFLLLLLAGTLEYVEGRLPPHFLRHGLLAVGVCLLASVALSRTLDDIRLTQSVFSLLMFATCALLLFRLNPIRRTLGARVAAVTFAASTLLWVVYGLRLYKTEHALPALIGQWLDQVGRFNGYLDAMLQILLACGMVLMLLEDARRETNAAHAELAVAHEKLLYESLTDPLTGVYNRLAFTRGVFLQSAGSTFGSVFIFDLDNLKRVNDSHGHEAGDELLRHFVATLRGGLRPADQLYRWGGDEFLLLLPGAAYAGVAPRLNGLLRHTPPLLFSAKEVPLSLEVSMGGADYSDLESLRAAVNTADRAMYEQKRIHKTAPPPGADLPPATS